jgi:hypothetical protein
MSSGKNNDSQGLKKTGLTAYILIAGFFAALWGEDIVRIDVGACANTGRRRWPIKTANMFH